MLLVTLTPYMPTLTFTSSHTNLFPVGQAVEYCKFIHVRSQPPVDTTNLQLSAHHCCCSAQLHKEKKKKIMFIHSCL